MWVDAHLLTLEENREPLTPSLPLLARVVPLLQPHGRGPREMLRYVMEEAGLRQEDLTDELGRISAS
jgi:hypothetical protein